MESLQEKNTGSFGPHRQTDSSCSVTAVLSCVGLFRNAGSVIWVSAEQQVGERTPLRLHFTQTPHSDEDSVAAKIDSLSSSARALRHSSR